VKYFWFSYDKTMLRDEVEAKTLEVTHASTGNIVAKQGCGYHSGAPVQRPEKDRPNTGSH
jgi:hypothetical protein